MAEGVVSDGDEVDVVDCSVTLLAEKHNVIWVELVVARLELLVTTTLPARIEVSQPHALTACVVAGDVVA